jgi:hypothetical protein
MRVRVLVNEADAALGVLRRHGVRTVVQQPEPRAASKHGERNVAPGCERRFPPALQDSVQYENSCAQVEQLTVLLH